MTFINIHASTDPIINVQRILIGMNHLHTQYKIGTKKLIIKTIMKIIEEIGETPCCLSK